MKSRKDIEKYLKEERKFLEKHDSNGELDQENYNYISQNIELLEWVLDE
jgi:hypothetical protein